MNAQIQYDSSKLLTSAVTPVGAPDVDAELVVPVRFGRRRSDPFGHLHVTSESLTFRGENQLIVEWDKVVGVAKVDCNVVFSLADTHRVLRFCCQNADDAGRVLQVARSVTIADSVMAAPHTPPAARS